jgi:hypothetical protein
MFAVGVVEANAGWRFQRSSWRFVMPTFAAICSSVCESSATSWAAFTRLAVRRNSVNFGELSSGIKKTAPTEAGAVPDWDGLPYSTKSLDRCRLLVSFNGLLVSFNNLR